MSILYRACLWVMCLTFSLSSVAQRGNLRQAIASYVSDKPAQIGVALIVEGRDTLCVNDTCHYPLMSVFKFHQAVALLHWVRANGVSLDMPVLITAADLKPDTYSPLRDDYPQGNVALPLRKLLAYTLQKSDNNACDILFDRTCGVKETDRYLHSLGIGAFSLEADEDDMHRCPERCYDNWSTPLTVARLLEMFFTHPFWEGEEETAVRQMMTECMTGRDRLAAPLEGTGAVIAHKTGTSDRNTRGLWTGINDVGFIRLPDGRHYTLVVLVRDSAATLEETSRYIADISALVFEALSGRTVL